MAVVVAASLLLLTTIIASVTSLCPTISDWRNSSVGPGGPLVCAKLYGNTDCTGFPVLFGVNASVSDFPHAYPLLVGSFAIDEAEGLGAEVVRTHSTCTVHRTILSPLTQSFTPY